MKIAVVNNFFPPRVGGSAHLSNALAMGYARGGHKVVVVTATYRDAPAFEERDGLKIFRLQAVTMPATRLAIGFDMAFTLRPSLGRRVAEILDAFEPDVIHQHGQFFDLTWATGAYARRRQIPVLLSVHTRLESPTPSYSRIFRALDALIVAPCLRRYKPTFVVMDVQMEAYIRDRYRKAISSTVDIPVGVEGAAEGGNGAVVRQRHGLADEAPVVLSIGHVIQMRDRVALVESLPHLRTRVPSAKVLVVGTVYVDRFETRAQELGVSDMIVSVGAVPHAQVRDYLAAAAVETHDLQGYGLGTASLEAMAAGVPVVAAVRPDNFGGLTLESGENCWLVPQDDPEALGAALATALTDRDLARRVGERGRSLVSEHFTMDVVLRRHLDTLRDMAGSTSD